jgi:protein N-terminal glutamine amidohydrolase
LYQAFYCEENIWHLCGDPRAGGDDRHVLFVSNEARRVAMWGQKASRDPGDPVVWDYHVVLLARTRTWSVWDFDSTLGLDVPLARWLESSFDAFVPEAFRPLFRCVEAGAYRRELASDRRHMRRPDGTEVSPAPPWPCIGRGHNLDRFIDVRAAGPGEVYDLAGLKRRFDCL